MEDVCRVLNPEIVNSTPVGIPPGSGLRMQRVVDEGTITLCLGGTWTWSGQAPLREEVFTLFGARPRQMCIDVTGMHIKLDDDTESNTTRTLIMTLMTFKRVADLIRVDFCVYASPALAERMVQLRMGDFVSPLLRARDRTLHEAD